MKYIGVVFDWGDTLSVINDKDVPVTNNWIKSVIHRLYKNSYRLGIISNTHRYQDAWWIRQELAKHDSLQYFECIVSSAIYGYHKPDVRLFQKLIDFMEVNPSKLVMVGDSEHCDGGAQLLGMTYMKVTPGENWRDRLFQLLDDRMPSSRKLTNVCEYGLLGDKLIVCMRHLSEAINVGDSLIVGESEYEVLEVSTSFTKEEVLAKESRNRYVQFKVRAI